MTATWQAPSVATPEHGCLEELRARYTERFPSWSQQFITVFSGKAAGGQRPPWFWTPPIVNWFLTLDQLSVAVLGSA